MRTSINGKHIAVLVHNYFEQAEFEEPISALKDAGAEVTIISTDKEDLTGMKHVELGDSFKADLMLDQANSGDYDALVLPGGAINADSLRVIEGAKQFLLDFLDSNKPVAAICHAPWLLVSADAVEGKRLTSFPAIRDDLINAGAEWVDQTVVVDGNLITSRNPDDLPRFNDEIIKMLSEQQESAIQVGGDNQAAGSEIRNEEDARIRARGYDLDKDDISQADEEEMLVDEDLDDVDALQPSGIVGSHEENDSY